MEISEIKYRIKYCVKPEKDCKTLETEPGQTNVTIESLEDRQLFEVTVAALRRNGTAGPFSEVIEHETDGT